MGCFGSVNLSISFKCCTTVFMLFYVHKFLMYCQYLLLYLMWCRQTLHCDCNCHLPWLCQCYSCVVTLFDVNCTPEWIRRSKTLSRRLYAQYTASTPVQCQKACEFDPHCVAVTWNWSKKWCYLDRDPNHQHRYASYGFDHYDLISRCSTTLGECNDSIRPSISYFERKLSNDGRQLFGWKDIIQIALNI